MDASEKVKISRENAEDEKDNELSMVDVLEEEEQLEADANAVLGGSDDKNCTYPLGYVGRQALYACATCSSEEREPGGICLACSLDCHDGHDLYELYTKRFFKCDCGNSKYEDMNCKLVPDKDAVNEDNKYNQNFRGLYCTCSRPYPDSEDDVEDEMIQCVVCEDWNHGRHLGADVPASGDYHEMICPDCMKRCDFLWAYNVRSKEVKVISPTKASGDVQVEVVTSESASTADDSISVVTSTTSTAIDGSEMLNMSKLEEKPSTSEEAKNSVNSSSTNETEVNRGSPTKRKACEMDKSDWEYPDRCVLKELQTREQTPGEGCTFWPAHWRRKLCKCTSCLEMYSNLTVLFLTEESDSVQSYEDRGRSQASTSQYITGMNALSGMDRVQLGEVMHGYNDLKESLRDYLKKFADDKKVVREEDIREFFSQMEARKRQKTGGYVPHFCK